MALRKLRFDDFRLDPARRELRRGDERLTLPPKVFDCIAYLAEHRDRAVGRDELIAAVWGRAEVADNLLDQIMLRARRALGDTEGERRIIRTVPRFGYAWVAPTEPLDEEAAPAPGAAEATAPASASLPAAPAATSALPASPSQQDASAPAPVPPRRRWRRVRWAAAALLLAGLLGWAGYALRGRDAAPPRAQPPANLALLLPVTIEADAKFAWARLGAMELIADRLRAAGQPMLPSDNVVALARGLRGAQPDAAELEGIVGTTAAHLVMQAHATLSAGYWRVSVDSLHGRDPPLHAEGEARDLMDAARAAADGAARALGLVPPADDELLSPRERALAGVLQQAEAAALADQPDTARALLDSLDAAQRALPEVRFRRAALDFQSGRLDEAQAGFQALLDSSSAQDDPLFRARVLGGLGNIAARRDDYAAEERHADAAIALLGDLPPSSELGRALTGRANARSAQFRFDDAVADFAQARVVLESVGDRFGLARIDANLGILEARRERYAEALPLLENAAARLATFHDLSSELFVRVAGTYAQLALLDPAAALRCWRTRPRGWPRSTTFPASCSCAWPAPTRSWRCSIRPRRWPASRACASSSRASRARSTAATRRWPASTRWTRTAAWPMRRCCCRTCSTTHAGTATAPCSARRASSPPAWRWRVATRRRPRSSRAPRSPSRGTPRCRASAPPPGACSCAPSSPRATPPRRRPAQPRSRPGRGRTARRPRACWRRSPPPNAPSRPATARRRARPSRTRSRWPTPGACRRTCSRSARPMPTG